MSNVTGLPLNHNPLAHRPPEALRQSAGKLEASFLAEMLAHAGFVATSEAFSGGIGEEQFGSFLREAIAEQMVEQGGIGLSEMLFNALARHGDAG